MQRVIGEGGPQDRLSIPLATRQGTFIPNLRKQEQSPETLIAYIDLWKEKLPSARLRSSTAVYNCVGLVFASRRTWVDTDILLTILEEDGYYRLAGLPDAEIGDLVIYRESHGNTITHIGIIAERQPDVCFGEWKITVISKWGGAGEYIHSLRDVPTAYGELVEFWSERRSGP